MNSRLAKLMLFTLALALGGGVMLALGLGIASGWWFTSVLDFTQQSSWFATNFAALIVGGIVGEHARSSRRHINRLLTWLAVAAGFLALLYVIGFADFGIFSSPHRSNWLWFPALGAIGIVAGFANGRG